MEKLLSYCLSLVIYMSFRQAFFMDKWLSYSVCVV